MEVWAADDRVCLACSQAIWRWPLQNCYGRWEDKDNYGEDEYVSMSSVQRVQEQQGALWQTTRLDRLGFSYMEL